MAGPKAAPLRQIVIWTALLIVIIVPIVLAGMSPLLAWREPIYIAAGFAGVIGLALILLQPLLAGGYLPGLPAPQGRRVHRWVGISLVLAVVLHVVGLWITSPPDVVDVLLFRSPTPCSLWGVAAMWAVFAAALIAVLRRRFPLRLWRLCHTALVVIVVIGTVVHAMLIEGTMETVSKAVLCALVLVATIKVIADLRVWAGRKRQKT